MFIWDSSLPRSYSKEPSCPSHSWSKGNIPWKTEPWSTAALPRILTPIVSTPLSVEYCGMGGVSAMETTGHPGIGACRLPPGPLHSRGLSVKAENFPLKLCQLSGVSRCPKLSPLLQTSSGLHTSIPPFILPMCFSPCCSLSSPSDPLLKIRCPLSPKVIPISPLISVSSYAIQKLNLGGKKEWHRKSLVSLLQTK